MQAVQVCLNAGAPVDAIQEDKSTPLHFACTQGSLDMVELMHDKQPDRFNKAMRSEDILKMTPLHRAALFDHVAVVEYLIQRVPMFLIAIRPYFFYLLIYKPSYRNFSESRKKNYFKNYFFILSADTKNYLFC